MWQSILKKSFGGFLHIDKSIYIYIYIYIYIVRIGYGIFYIKYEEVFAWSVVRIDNHATYLETPENTNEPNNKWLQRIYLAY